MTTPPQQHGPNPEPSSHTATIDALLHRYLALLDEYTTLRASLGALQASVFQSLARANFVSAQQHGRPYGQDYYDERMQALRRVGIREEETSGEEEEEVGGDGEGERETGGMEETKTKERGNGGGKVVFTVGTYPPAPRETESAAEAGGGGTEKEPGDGDGVPDQDPSQDTAPPPPGEKDRQKEETPPRPPRDPLRWFGILTPFPLREAQAQSIKAVEEIIPRLATVNAEMAAVELEVRRARKKRAKAEKVEERRRQELEQKPEGVGAAA
ncbi:hypothetical protein VTK26DRAFT_6635 [Humicola hyalothermophila]